ncbi:MAG: hypothetical protein U0871_06245 [Gemmataceae bacterium]
MSVVRGTVTNGKIVLDAPPDWPDGTEVEVRSSRRDGVHSDLSDQRDDPESVAAWVAWVESLQPFLTEAEEAEWQKARAERKAASLAGGQERAEHLRKIWE